MRSGLFRAAWRICAVFSGLASFLPSASGAASPDGLACAAAGRAAERQADLPADLLRAIGYVESGRPDAVTGAIAAWPWTVNVDGAGRYFADERDAAAFAEAAMENGARDVDVGCFQISLQQHPGAFASIDTAFDPAANANFAGGFLRALKGQAGSWETAVADYHSSLPVFGLPYQRRVLSAWRLFGDAPPGLTQEFFALPDPTIILLAPAAERVRVITPDGFWQGPRPAGRLPRVITP